MKAIVCTQFGSPDVLRFEEVPKPVPGDHQVLVKIRATSVNPLDKHLLRGRPLLVRFMGFGILKPKRKIVGADISGRVDGIGKDVTQFKVGDEVFGSGMGGYAEYVSIGESRLVLKPAEMTFEQAAAVPIAALTALQGLRDHGKIREGEKVLVNGASGGVGTFAVQLAKSFGADVTGVCSTRNLELVRSLGADHVIDYTKGNFTKDEKRYDLILDAASFRPISDYLRIMTAEGRYILIGGAPSSMFRVIFRGIWNSLVSKKKLKLMMTNTKAEDLRLLTELIKDGSVKPVIDRSYSLSEVPDALRYLEEGHARGKIVITVSS